MARQRLTQRSHAVTEKEAAVQKLSVELKRKEKDLHDSL
jgi:hypothetical protein